MNERIRQLARQADAMAREIITDLREIPVYNRIRDEKFAELIVRECIGICNDTNDASYLNGVIAGRKIKQHFGVE